MRRGINWPSLRTAVICFDTRMPRSSASGQVPPANVCKHRKDRVGVPVLVSKERLATMIQNSSTYSSTTTNHPSKYASLLWTTVSSRVPIRVIEAQNIEQIWNGASISKSKESCLIVSRPGWGRIESLANPSIAPAKQ